MKDFDKVSTPEDLIEWMRRMNLSLTAAANELGRKRTTVTRYLRGESPLPQSVGRHAELIEASRHGQPFEKKRRRKSATENPEPSSS